MTDTTYIVSAKKTFETLVDECDEYDFEYEVFAVVLFLKIYYWFPLFTAIVVYHIRTNIEAKCLTLDFVADLVKGCHMKELINKPS